jgi:hypothetical protein
MLTKKIPILLSILFLFLAQAQRKKRKDTVVIYEKVIVYDTIYKSRAFKIKAAPLQLSKLDLNFRRINFPAPQLKNTEEKPTEKITENSWNYGISAGLGLKNNSWYPDKKPQFGASGSLWLSKTLFIPKFTLMLSANAFFWNSSFDLDANKEETFLDGFYFTKDQQPLLFQRFNNKHSEFFLQLKALYEWKNFRPFAGITASQSFYKMQFLVPENKVLNKLNDFKNRSTDFGFVLGMQYRISRKISLDLEYQELTRKGLNLRNSDFDFEIFKSNSNFAERKILAGISYRLSR